jgi:hypothetical protein
MSTEHNAAGFLDAARSAERAATRQRIARDLRNCPSLPRLDELANNAAMATPQEKAHLRSCFICNRLVEKVQAESGKSVLGELFRRVGHLLASIRQPVPLPIPGALFGAAEPAGLQGGSGDGRLTIQVLDSAETDSLTVVVSTQDGSLANQMVGLQLLPGPDGQPVCGFAVLGPHEIAGWFVARWIVGLQGQRPLGGTCTGVEAAPIDVAALSASDRRTLLDAIAADLERGHAVEAWRQWAHGFLARETDLPVAFREELARLVDGD